MAATWEIGDEIPLAWDLEQPEGTPINATVTLTITLPDGTTTSPTVTNPAVGSYLAAYVPAMNGTYTYRYVATGAVTQADSGVFTVGGVGSLTALKATINKRGLDTGNDPELQRFLDGGLSVIEHIVGPIQSRTITNEQHTPTGAAICLRRTPVLSVTSVIEYRGSTGYVHTAAATPAAATTDSYLVDTSLNCLTRLGASGFEEPFTGPVFVTYVAGYSPVPESLHEAVLLQAAHLYQRTQLGGKSSGAPNALTGSPAGGFGFGIPNEVRELVEPFLRRSGFA